MVIDEVCPFLGIIFEPLDLELLKKSLVKLIHIDDGSRILKLCTELRHFQGLLFVIRQIESPAKILVGLRLR